MSTALERELKEKIASSPNDVLRSMQCDAPCSERRLRA